MEQLRSEFERASDRLRGQAIAATLTFRVQAGDWRGVAEAKHAQLDLTHDHAERLALYRDLGQLYAERLGDPDRATEAYQQALALQPGDASLLHALHALHISTERWEDAVHTLDRLAALEPDAGRRCRHRREAAEILCDRLHAPLEAIERLEEALDDDPTMLEAL
ncbi:MAG: tetratricopeptide repeat protein, partial [Myxococcales bacterium]|nr:tetratricopeptide repeat protein [Myxococcales bacterium]